LLIANGIPVLKYSTNINENNYEIIERSKEIKMDNMEEDKKMIPTTILVPAPVLLNPIIKAQKNYFGKYPKKKSRPFTEREGDWICKNCKNLNFSFRNECNRCKLLKRDCMEVIKSKGENDSTSNKSNQKFPKHRHIYANEFFEKKELATNGNKNGQL
jgi:hypothetical protein